jgi:hypothetical protein
MQPRRLTESQLFRRNPQLGFELMKNGNVAAARSGSEQMHDRAWRLVNSEPASDRSIMRNFL